MVNDVSPKRLALRELKGARGAWPKASMRRFTQTTRLERTERGLRRNNEAFGTIEVSPKRLALRELKAKVKG